MFWRLRDEQGVEALLLKPGGRALADGRRGTRLAPTSSRRANGAREANPRVRRAPRRRGWRRVARLRQAAVAPRASLSPCSSWLNASCGARGWLRAGPCRRRRRPPGYPTPESHGGVSAPSCSTSRSKSNSASTETSGSGGRGRRHLLLHPLDGLFELGIVSRQLERPPVEVQGLGHFAAPLVNFGEAANRRQIVRRIRHDDGELRRGPRRAGPVRRGPGRA